MLEELYSSLEGTPIMMWVDAVEGKNVINVLSQTGLEDVMITGFLVSGSSYEQLYAICVDATYELLFTPTLKWWESCAKMLAL